MYGSDLLTDPTKSLDGETAHQIMIEDVEVEPELLARFVLDDPDTRDHSLEIHLIRGGLERNSDKLIEQRSGKGGLVATIVPSLEFGIGLYLFTNEQNGAPEEKAWDSLAKSEKIEWQEWSNQQTRRDRRLRLVDQLEDARVDWRAEPQDGLPTFQKTLEEGRFRDNNGMSGAEERLAKRLTAHSEGGAGRCYENAQTAIELAWDDDRVDYVEGVALQKQGIRAVRHAWLEINGSVGEVTWPWHSPVSENDAVYYGAIVERDKLENRMDSRGFDPMLFDNDEWVEYLEYMDKIDELYGVGK